MLIVGKLIAGGKSDCRGSRRQRVPGLGLDLIGSKVNKVSTSTFMTSQNTTSFA